MASPRIHPFWRLFLCALVVLGVTLAVTGVGAGVLIAFTFKAGTSESVKQLTTRLTHDYGLWPTVFAYPPALFVIWLFRTKVDNRSWASLGFSRAGAASNFGRGALVGFLTLSVLFSLMWLAGALRFNGLSSDVLTRGWPYAVLALSGYFLAFLLVGFMEEISFRGYGLHNLHEWLGWRGAVAVQAVVFALIHLGNATGSSDPNALKAAIGALPSLALIAVFFAVSYRKTGSLWFPIGFHAAWNFCLGCVFSQPVSAIGTFRLFDVRETGASFLSGGDFGAEGSFFLIPLILALIYFLSLAPDHPLALANLNAPDFAQTPAYAPQYAPAPLASALPDAVPSDADDEPRANRYGARFGSATGFDSGTLRELTQMQEAREAAERERAETVRASRRAEELREEELRRVQIAALPPLIPVEGAPSQTLVAVEASVEAPVAAESNTGAPVALAPEPSARIEAPSAPPRPSLEPRKTLEPRKASTLPAPTATAPTATALSPVLSEPVASPTAPTDAPPKKNRPRW